MSDLSRKPYVPTANQKQAIGWLQGRLFIAAGAGSGKTAVVSHRFVEAIASGAAKVNEILTITFTNKAAAEMMHRIREVLKKRIAQDTDPERVMRMYEAYRDIESARISTIDSFCSSLLRTYALTAGIDPDFAVADSDQAALLSRECFERSLTGFVTRHGDAAADLVTAYDPGLSGRLLSLVVAVYRELRSRGRPVKIPLPDAESLIADAAARLKTAMADFEATVDLQGCRGKTVDAILEGNQRLREALSETDPSARLQIVQQSRPGGNAGRVNADRQLLETAWSDYLSAIRSPQALKSLKLFGVLLREYDEIYAAEKHGRGLLDFADLSLFARELLLSSNSLRAQVAGSFKLIMVDEFQDTNPLQHEIIESIAGDNLMLVGDENQSIFGFRDAEVDLFREEDRRAEAAGYRIPLVENFRSQKEILAFVDELFGSKEMLAPGYLKLDPKADPDLGPEDFRVEVIMADLKPPGAQKKVSVEDARQVEAQLIAERLLELYKEGAYGRGDTAILVRNRTGVEAYRDALERNGIKAYLAIGVTYYQSLEMADVINLHRLLVNPLDDEALVGVLRSPMVRVSDDVLYWLRASAGRDVHGDPAPLWRVISSGKGLERFPGKDRLALDEFAAGLKSLRLLCRQEPLHEIARRVLLFNDYAAAAAAGQNGKQVLANLMKLIDMASDYEAVWGRDLPGFVDFLVNQKSAGVREAEPPIEEEGVDAVRIMTMHVAKGLEFPLVVLPKLADKRGGPNDKPDLLIDRDSSTGRVGLKFRSLTEEPFGSFYYDQLGRDLARRDLEEEKRIHYVAMTRAKRHLILVGCCKADEKPKKGDDGRPFDWIRVLLGLDRKTRPDLDGLSSIDDLEAVRVGLSVCASPDDVLERAKAATAAHVFESPPPVPAEIRSLLKPPIYVPPVISPTALDTFAACPRRYFLETLVRADELLEVPQPGVKTAQDSRLSRPELGTLVHSLLETDLPLPGAGAISPESINTRACQLWGPEISLSEADHRRVIELIGNFQKATVASRLFAAAGNGELERELSFSTLLGETIVRGKIDALVPAGSGLEGSGTTLVVDYKTGAPGEGRTADEAAGPYKHQMAAYALAAFRLFAKPVEVVLLFLGGTEPQQSRHIYDETAFVAVEAELKQIINAMSGGDFEALSQFDSRQCPWCAGGPQGARLCKGSSSQTAAGQTASTPRPRPLSSPGPPRADAAS